jgi:hypothetical protein
MLQLRTPMVVVPNGTLKSFADTDAPLIMAADSSGHDQLESERTARSDCSAYPRRSAAKLPPSGSSFNQLESDLQ